MNVLHGANSTRGVNPYFETRAFSFASESGRLPLAATDKNTTPMNCLLTCGAILDFSCSQTPSATPTPSITPSPSVSSTPSVSPSPSNEPRPVLLQDMNDLGLLNADYFITHNDSTYFRFTGATNLPIRRIDANDGVLPFDESFIKGSYTSTSDPQNPTSLQTRLTGDSTPSGREITLISIRNGASNQEVAALTTNAEGTSELRWTASDSGISTFVELQEYPYSGASSSPTTITQFTGADGYARAAVISKVGTGDPYILSIIGFDPSDDTPIVEAQLGDSTNPYGDLFRSAAPDTSGILYAVKGSDPKVLVKITPSGGTNYTETQVATLGTRVSGLKWHASKLYMNSVTGTTSRIFAYDPADDSVTEVAGQSTSVNAVAPALQCNGHLYLSRVDPYQNPYIDVINS